METPAAHATGRKKRLQNLTLFFISILLTFLMLEFFLRSTDPLGIIVYYKDGEIYNFRQDEQRGYVVEPGRYQFTRWSATINPDNTRFVPDTSVSASCTIAAVGDSMTFGQGVNDDETWLNLIAGQFPDVHFINAGVPGYNMPNILASIKLYREQVDGFLYTMIDNDNESPAATQIPFSGKAIQYSAMLLYGYALTVQKQPSVSDTIFYAQLETLMNDPALVVTAFNTGGISSEVAKRYPSVFLQPVWMHFISPFDRHPDPAGHQEIARSVEPVIRELVQRVCR